jgi:hypothetical protein
VDAIISHVFAVVIGAMNVKLALRALMNVICTWQIVMAALESEI